jgi:hypothetical protein
MADDGLARAIRIAHGTGDGDTVFTLATGTVAGDPNLNQIGGAAADALSRAIMRAIRAAKAFTPPRATCTATASCSRGTALIARDTGSGLCTSSLFQAARVTVAGGRVVLVRDLSAPADALASRLRRSASGHPAISLLIRFRRLVLDPQPVLATRPRRHRTAVATPSRHEARAAAWRADLLRAP